MCVCMCMCMGRVVCVGCMWCVGGGLGLCLQHRPHIPQRRLHLGELDGGDPERPDIGEATVRALGYHLGRHPVRSAWLGVGVGVRG